MVRSILVAAAFFTAAAISAQQFVVVNKMPPVAKATAVVTTIQTTYRQAHGHTHTDAAGHSWDHQSNPGHVCNALVVRNGQIVRCGLPQYVQDRSPRSVTVTRVVSVPQASTAVQAIPVQSPRVQSFDMLFGTGGGCPNGNCANLRR
jgi:hypothetical protein